MDRTDPNATPDGRAAVPETVDQLLQELRAAGWEVAAHSHYRQNDQPHTLWRFTHPNRRWVSGEAMTDREALRRCRQEALRVMSAFWSERLILRRTVDLLLSMQQGCGRATQQQLLVEATLLASSIVTSLRPVLLTVLAAGTVGCSRRWLLSGGHEECHVDIAAAMGLLTVTPAQDREWDNLVLTDLGRKAASSQLAFDPFGGISQ